MLLIVSIAGRRRLEAADIPFAVGVSRRGAVLWGEDAEDAPALWLRSHERRVYVQPEAGARNITHNDSDIGASAWLAPGDRIGIGRVFILVGEEDGLLTLQAETEAMPAVPAAPASPPPPAPPEEPPPDAPAVDAAPPPRAIPLRARRSGGGWRNLAIGVFATLLIGVGFVLGASAVRIDVRPGPERLAFKGTIPPVPFGARYLAVPGTYTVTAERAGYRRLEETVKVPFASRLDLAYEMKKQPGRLTVTTVPALGAAIAIDGKPVGTAPLTDIEADAGKRKIRATAERYLPEETTVEIRGLGEKQAVALKLRPGWGALTVSSDPPGATVKLGDREFGVTPLLAEPMAGSYRMTLTREGWKPASSDVTIAAGQVLTLPPIKMERIDGFLDVVTDPPGAEITIEGKFQGISPLSATLVSGRSYKVAATRAGYAPANRSVQIEGAKTSTLRIGMKPEYGIVFLRTKPAGATLVVDGKEMGSASQRLRLTTEPHRLEIRKEGYVTKTATIEPRKGLSKTYDVTLRTEAELMRDRAEKPVKAAGGPMLKLVPIEKPVTFTMGASRREAGRRANETQYKVTLTRSFLIGEMEISNADFRKFKATHDSGSDQGRTLDADGQPVAQVTWDDAARYANWLSAKESLPPAYKEEKGRMVAVTPMTEGYRLPTEAEWAFVARYEGGRLADGAALKYPWGGAMPPAARSGNYADSSATRRLASAMPGYSDGFPVSSPIASFQANGAGLYDIGGNVAEWCHDYYDTFIGPAPEGLKDPMGPDSGTFHVLRGSSWRHGTITELRLSFRDYSKEARNDVGFRVARYVDPPK